jgi:hypothetical protein
MMFRYITSLYNTLRAKLGIKLKDVEHVINKRYSNQTITCAVTRW